MRLMINICAITHHHRRRRRHHHHLLCMLTVSMSAQIDDYRKRNGIESRVNEISDEKTNNSENSASGVNGHWPL